MSGTFVHSKIQYTNSNYNVTVEPIRLQFLKSLIVSQIPILYLSCINYMFRIKQQISRNLTARKSALRLKLKTFESSVTTAGQRKTRV